MDKISDSSKEIPNPNQKQPQQNKQSLAHSEMMQFLHKTLFKRNQNI